MKISHYVFVAALTLAAFAAGACLPHRITATIQEQPNGDYRLLLHGRDRALVCEEKDAQIIQQPDAVTPMVIECKH